jgi:hypothetical protein
MKKIFLIPVLGMIFLIVAGVFVASVGELDVSQEVKEVVERFTGGNVSASVEGFVGEFVEKRGIESSEITDIKQVDFETLPKEVNIEGVGDHNLAIYEIDYLDEETNKEEQVFIISYAVEKLKAQGDIIIASDKRNFLNFGTSETMSSSGFLETATGVETSHAKGYLMMRSGSITALSTNLEIIQSNPGAIEIIVYKNGQPISFGNTLSGDSLGVEKDYDVQSKDVVRFEPGDVISAYVRADSGLAWRDVITLIEITTED